MDKVPSYVADAIRWISSCHRDDMGMDDGHTDEIASMFYKHMVQAVKSGQLDYTRAAFALHETMKSGDMPFDQRILYIYLGAYVLACFLALHCLLFIMYGRPYRHCTACKLSEIRQPYLILYDLASSTNQHVYRQLLHTSAERQAPSLLPFLRRLILIVLPLLSRHRGWLRAAHTHGHIHHLPHQWHPHCHHSNPSSRHPISARPSDQTAQGCRLQ